MNRKQTLDLIKKYNIRPTRSLGQNFLVDENVAVNIGKLAELGPDDLVIEIGAGVGGLTSIWPDRPARFMLWRSMLMSARLACGSS
ncbi:MAG: rRNA adenine N-6-methyltransferase family protein [Saccharofermentanales bacterium]